MSNADLSQKERPDPMTYRYTAFGLIIDSCLELPELLPADGLPDIRIQWGKVPELLPEARKTTQRFQAKPGYLLFCADQVARLLVSHGSVVVIEPLPEATEAEIRPVVLGSALGAILHQRGLLPIHASGIKTAHGCMMFCGRPGAGKSTLAGAFVERGFDLHADDLCVIGMQTDGRPQVYPAYPRLKLWGDALITLGKNPDDHHQIPTVPDKFAVQPQQFNREPLPVDCMYLFSPHSADVSAITPITGMSRYQILKQQLYRRRFLEGLGTTTAHFNLISSIATSVPLYRVHRPRDLSRLDCLVDLLIQHIEQGEYV